ncbi:MAG: hypothetical protein WC760_12060 [Bacteroidia bacterium]|jgi:hypothetical protein
MQRNKLIAFTAVLLFAGISLLKDDFTPDYLNTPSAAFIQPGTHSESIFQLWTNHAFFWLTAVGYSLLFVAFPYLIIRLLFNPELAMMALLITGGLFLLEYTMVLSNNLVVMKHILPKVNRYFHSPIIVLFLIAAFKINQHFHGSD